MAMTGMSDDFDLDDHGILRDSFASDFHVDDDGILHDDLDLFKHAVNTAGHGTDSGFGGDKQSSTSTLQHLHASFDEDLAPIGDESINISDFEASRDDLDNDSFDGDFDREKRSKSHRGARELETPGSTLERPLDGGRQHDYGAGNGSTGPSKRSAGHQRGGDHHQGRVDGGEGRGGGGEQDLFSEEYYQQLRELGVLVDGADFSRDESQTEFEALEQHLSRDHIDYHPDGEEEGGESRDLIGEYLQDEYQREHDEEEEEEEGGQLADLRDRRNQYGGAGGGVPNSRASSAPTISGRSFPEISPEDAEMMYGSSEQTNNNNDDDEIFLINNHLLPGGSSSGLHMQKLPDTPGPDSRPETPRGTSGQARARQSPQGRHGHRSRSEANTPHKSRPDSAASHVSESARPRSGRSSPGGAGGTDKSAMSKARSQESFFESDREGSGRKSGGGGGGGASDKLPKRLLPTPGTGESGSQSFRVKSKSKSVSNISGGKGVPIKPTHMSLSEITRGGVMDGGGEEGVGDKSEGELSKELKQESSKRKQATELVQMLQQEYDSLLSKYALAELTIDQFRLGARIHLHSDSPTPTSIQSGRVASPAVGGQAGQMSVMTPPVAQRAVVSQFNSANGGDGPSMSTAHVQTSDGHHSHATTGTGERRLPSIHGHGHHQDSGGSQGALYDSEDRSASGQPVAADTIKLNIQTQAASLNDRLDQFHTLMENRQLTLEEQEQAFENIRTDHEKLRRSYLQAKEDYKVLRRSGASLPDGDFDGDKELEGHLFRLGMKFDEVHENVDSNLKAAQTTRRKPFQAGRLTPDLANQEDGDQDGDQPDGQTAGAGSEDAEFEKHAEHLHTEYRALMDRYRRLKQMAPSSEQENETDNVVRKLKDICVEMPDMFRLPPEVQDRFKDWKKKERLKIYNRLNNVYERLSRRDQHRSPVPQSGEEGAVGGAYPPTRQSSSLPPGSKVRGSPLVGDHSISTYISGRKGSRDSHMDDSLRRSQGSLMGSRSSLDMNSSTVALRSSASPSPSDQTGRGSPSSMDGAAAPRDRDGYDPRINRPSRHQHGFRDPKLSKRPDRGSYSSLPDSGISDQEGRERRPDDRLAHLPGPGKMKEMTRGQQRGENDMDSGFIGSVVSGEGAPPPPSPQEAALRLRDRPPTDRNHNRSRLDSSGSTSTVASMQPGGGGGDRRTRGSKLRSSANASTGVGQHSTDRSYDGELDESTASDRHLQPRDARPKEPRSGILVGGRSRRREEGSLRSVQSSRSTGSQLQSSTLEDETLEDVSDGEMTDVSTPRQMEPSEASSSRQQVPGTPNRPPTPHRPPTPQRPPTPYRLEEDGPEVEGRQPETAVEGGRPRSRRPSADELVHNRSQQQQRRSRSPGPPDGRGPGSRGETNTDVYDTRHRRQRSADRDSLMSAASSRAGSRYGRHSEVSDRVRGEDAGVGSDVEIRSDITRESSVNSARLKALQDEIEKLKEGVKSAHEKASERRTPPPQPQQPQPPPAAAPQQEGPEYYDPFDDPYGFMRMPRRRANSFSGGRTREFDDWYWNLPNDKRNAAADAEIPLGYAAADAYNRHHRDKTPEAARQRLRHRRRTRRGDEETEAKTLDPHHHPDAERFVEREMGFQSTAPPMAPVLPAGAPVPPQIRRPPVSDPQAMFNYFVPSRHGVRNGTGNPPPVAGGNPYRQHTTPLSASQPNLAGTLAGVQPQTFQYGTGTKPWYQIRRSQWPAASSSGQYFPTKGYQATRSVPDPVAQTAAVYYASAPPQHAAGPPVAPGPATPHGHTHSGYRTELCPLCGGAGAHIHEEDVDPVYGYAAQDFATQPGIYSYRTRRHRRHEHQGRTRQRSRSVSRSRHYTPERSSSNSRYMVREYGDSASEDSDLELNRGRRRSRSLSRSRGQSETRSSSARSSSRRSGRRYRRKNGSFDSDEDVDLNESLVLSKDINRLTKRMVGTVRAELKQYKDKKEFGSSYW